MKEARRYLRFPQWDDYIDFEEYKKALAEEIKEKYPNKTIWLYTGYKWEEIWHYPMMKNIDVLVDGEYVEEQRDTKLLWKGSSNQRVIDVQATLQKSDKLIPVLHCGDYS